MGNFFRHNNWNFLIKNHAVRWNFCYLALMTIVCLMLLPAGWRQIGTVLVIVNAAPIGSNIAVYAQRLGLDSSYAVQMVCLSTLLSLITLPVMLSLAAALGFA